MDDLEILVPIALFVSLAAVIILRGPIGGALADRLAGRTGLGSGPAPGTMTAELDDLRHRVEELEERLDFAKRRLAHERRQLAPPADVERRS